MIMTMTISSCASHDVMSATTLSQTHTRASSTASSGSLILLSTRLDERCSSICTITTCTTPGANTWSTSTFPAWTNIPHLLTTTTFFTALRSDPPWRRCWWYWWCHRWRSTTSTWSRMQWGSFPVSSTSTLAPLPTMASLGLSAKHAQGNFQQWQWQW